MIGGALIGAVAPTVLPVSVSAHSSLVCAGSFFRCLVRVLLLSVFPVQMSSWFEFPPSIGALACLHEGWAAGACVLTGGLSGIM